MKFKPLEHFSNRAEEIKKFEELIEANNDCWVMLVDGLSGTGKSLLLDWLRQTYCADIPSAKLTLTLGVNLPNLLRDIADQLSQDISKQYRKQVAELEAAYQQQTLVNYAPSFTMNATLKGSIQGSTQQSEMPIALGTLQEMVKLEREAERLNVFIEALQGLGNKQWILFIDEASYLANPELKHFILEQLLVRLHTRYPGFHVYMTGQMVPKHAFSMHEKVTGSLETFTLEHTRQLLKNVGLPSDEVGETAYNATLGHPLLLGMLIEDMLQSGPSGNLKGLAETIKSADESMRTSSILDRTLSHIEDPLVKRVAENLALFEWFDLGLLRSVFGAELTQAGFDELIERSFIKELEPGRWKCHDIIVKHLRSRREDLIGPDEADKIHQSAYNAFIARLDRAEEKTGIWNFEGRITLVGALLHHALSYSPAMARAFTWQELGRAFDAYDADYLYSLMRLFEAYPLPDDLKALAERSQDAIEAINLREYNPPLVSFLEELAKHVIEAQMPMIAAGLSAAASRIASALGKDDVAIKLIKQAADLAPTPHRYRRAAELMIQKSGVEAANAILAEGEAKCGTDAEFQIARATIAFAQDNKMDAVRILTEAVAEFPDQDSVRLELANLFIADEKFEAALAQVEAVPADAPSYEEAVKLRMGLLVLLGRLEEAMSLTRTPYFPMNQIVEEVHYWLYQLANPASKARILNEITVAPDSIPATFISQIMQVLAVQGDVENVARLSPIMDAKWPEAHDLSETNVALAYMTAGHPDKALAITEPIAARSGGTIDTYFVLAACSAQKKEFTRQRAALEKMAQLFSTTRDEADFHIVHSYLNEGASDVALDFLKKIDQQRTIGPAAQEAWADVLLVLGEVPQAAEILRRLIYTAERGNIQLGRLVGVRQKYALLLVQLGKRDEAEEIASELLTLSVGKHLTVPAAYAIFYALGHEEGIRAAFHSYDRWRAIDLSSIYEALTQLILKRNNTIDGLLAELARTPDRLELVYAIDRIMTLSGNLGQAEPVFTEVERIAPGSVAKILALQEQVLEEAHPQMIAQMQAAKARMPTDPTPRIALLRLLLAQQNFDEAKREADELIALNPAFSDLAKQITIKALITADQMDEAKALLEPLLAVNPPPSVFLEVMILYFRAVNEPEAEINLHLRIAESYPALRQTAYRNAIDLYIDLERYTDALDIVKQLEKEGELEVELLVGKAIALREAGQIDDSLKVLDSILEISNISDDERSTAYHQKGNSLFRSERLDEAAAAYIKAIETSPEDYASSHFRLADVFIAQEEWVPAYEELMNGLALAPERLTIYEGTLKSLREKIALQERAASESQPPSDSNPGSST